MPKEWIAMLHAPIDWHTAIPFLLTKQRVTDDPEGLYKVDIKRVVEIVIVLGGIAIGMYSTQQVMMTEVNHLRTEVRDLSKELKGHLAWEMEELSKRLNHAAGN